MFDSQNCTVVPDDARTDPGVAGAGILLSFIITAGLSIVLSAVIILYELRGQSKAKISRKMLQSMSDQQIITGIGIQCVGLAKMTTMIPYHFFIVWMLSVLSTATHIATLLALVNDFRRDWVLRWLRQFLMFVNLVLSCVSGIFVLMSVMKGLEPTLPIACVWRVDDRPKPDDAALSVAGTIAVLAGNCIVFVLGVWYLHSKRQPWVKTVQVFGLVVLVAIAVGSTVRVILMSQAFGDPDLPLRGASEKDWSFGQLLSVLLLIMPLISAVEIVRGEMKVPSPLPDDRKPLFHEEEKHNVRQSFQPNPFWGSQASLFKK
ncbi:hypothetical protein BDY21DRAFT_346695 [Lineolata rhizophorae]|uniref:Uncharacterized protein n=1 Tax=Lineolata rhizophorae TaxID=578093 RepID=A0A6A6NZ15_9PEZI|nr:hypothetical protein BDY21DRAFT_346695 [Lineolata rhizophorae]